LSLSTRVVTAVELNGKLEGIKRIEVPRRAVVTPAARDYLRERGVQLIYATT
jgi:ethanolamine utilization cobalamin adenosyltransferase